MKIFRFFDPQSRPKLAVSIDDERIFELPQAGFVELVRDADAAGVKPGQWIASRVDSGELPPLQAAWADLRLAVPLEAPEVWAAGVTYERSRDARNYESTGGKLDAVTFYDKVYDAERPELFLKSTAARTVGPGETVCLRSDSDWQIPEPELGVVVDRTGRILGYTIGNDMSCRDIEGENPLYLPQAKVWKRSCAIGPVILLAEAVEDPYRFQITCTIYRNGGAVFEGKASTGQLKRKLEELVSFLIRDNDIFDGTVLLTGTGAVPPNDFPLQGGDRVEIAISGIGVLVNPVLSLR